MRPPFRPELISQSNRLPDADPQTNVCSGQSSYPNRIDYIDFETKMLHGSGQSSYPNRIDSGLKYKPIGTKFRPELISQSNRLSGLKNGAISVFRPELISQSNRLDSQLLLSVIRFRPELISQSNRLCRLWWSWCCLFRPELISQSNRLGVHRGH